MAYDLTGRLLEVCDCDVLCPCWVGSDPDNGTCQAIAAWRIDRGSVDGLDVSGLTIAVLDHIPGNILQGNHKVVIVIDDQATQEQAEALLAVWSGKHGGPIAHLSELWGELRGVERQAITFTVEGGQGRIVIGDIAEATMAPMVGATGQPTTLHDTVFSTIPGSPAYVARASHYRMRVPALEIDLDLSGHNAIQGNFRLVS